MNRALQATLVLSALLLLGGLAAPQGAPHDDVPLDDVKGRWLNYETGPIQPIAFAPGSGRLWAVNQPGARLVELDPQDLSILREIPTGPGLVSIAFSPARPQVWAVDRVTSCVAVVDLDSGQMLFSIRVGAEPHGIAFTASGDRAYVTCAAVDRVDVIETATYEVVRSLPIPAKEPRGIARVGDRLYVAPFLSGDGSAPRGDGASGWLDDVVRVGTPRTDATLNALPDRDLFQIRLGASAAEDVLEESATVTELGTVLFNVRARPGSDEVWVPHTDSYASRFRGVNNFIDGIVAQNRLAVVDVEGGQPDRETDVRVEQIDLIAPSYELRCAAPTDVAFTSDGARAFVAGYGSDRIMVVDATSEPLAYLGTIHVQPPAGGFEGAGPRGLAIDGADEVLAIYNKATNSVTRVELSQLPTGAPFEHTAPPAVPLGFDPTPPEVVRGRLGFIDNEHSLRFTSSCNSCHVDGHTDGMVWDLGYFLDPRGTPNNALEFPLDEMGPMYTKSLRGVKETAPYHWRGEKAELTDFDQAFVELLLNEEDGVPSGVGEEELADIVTYMSSLVWPANPRQDPARELGPRELRGLELFRDQPVSEAATCATCHALPLGTSGEVLEVGGGSLVPSLAVPSLRGVADKLTPAWHIGGDYATRTELGAGLGHAGAFPTFEAFLLQLLPPPATGQRFDLTPAEAADLASFLSVFDTGLAPAAAYQATANPLNHQRFASEHLDHLTDQARAGSCDLVYSFGPLAWSGRRVSFRGLYDPDTGRFRQASRLSPPVAPTELLELAAAGTPVTFYGLPRWTGLPTAIDRDVDGLLDLDEARWGTDPEAADSDGDGYPDGYEVDWSMDPLVADASCPDADPPSLASPVELVYATTNTVKLEWVTDEPARFHLSHHAGHRLEQGPLGLDYDTHFSVVVDQLEPDTPYSLRVHLEDPAGNAADVYALVTTRAFHRPEPGRVTSIVMSVDDPHGASPRLVVDAGLRLGGGAPGVGYELEGAAYYAEPGSATVVDLDAGSVHTDASGAARFELPIPTGLPLGAGELYFAVRRITSPDGSPPYVEAYDAERFARLAY